MYFILFYFFVCHGSHISSVLFYRVCLHLQMYLPLYKDGMTHTLCNHKFYFYVLLCLLMSFNLKVTLCNNNVTAQSAQRLVDAGSSEWLVLSYYCWFLQDAKAFFAYRVCIVIIKPTGTLNRNIPPSSFTSDSTLPLVLGVSSSCHTLDQTLTDVYGWGFWSLSLFYCSHLALNW